MKKQNPSGEYNNFGKPPKSVMLPNLDGKNMQTLKPVKWTPIKLILLSKLILTKTYFNLNLYFLFYNYDPIRDNQKS
ncbi:hypothetical protein PL11201_80012 [Planktothrix sp. PCC 11201]|uniref:hypothetical protein n=1 Tax=Planktothrix sp. PCC 11201 TaxID=1729650 RepID=UPI000913DC5F|nr:hypothetical protein [Planktothrix sp. PCC 11201]SKB15703.1 hypothetical protein PL11201_80012 [Planktothrix sp. PCC 11201]